MTETNGAKRPSPKTVGNVSEAIVLARLVELGYGVSIPFGDSQRYDFVVDDGETLTRAQVKTGRLRKGSVVFPARSVNGFTNERRGYAGEADDFLVYCPDTDEIYRIPVDECGQSKTVALRVDARGSNRGRTSLRWARDHVFSESARLLKMDPLKACAINHPDSPPRLAVTRASGGGTRRYCKECSLTWCRRSRARKAAESAPSPPA